MRAVVMALGSVCVAIANAAYGQSFSLVLFVVFAVGVLSTLLSAWRLGFAWPVTYWELAGQLILDVGLLMAVFIYTGGSSNPFISYFLVLVAIAAATLPRRLSVGIALAAVAVYSILMAYDLSAQGHAMHGPDAFRWHLVGMWAIFVVSAILITYSVSTLAKEVRRREAGLAKARERVMRNEQVVAVGALAAGVAHGLGTPLNTMAVLLKEMEAESGNAQWREDIALLTSQVRRCRDELRRLSDVADHQVHPQGRQQHVSAVVNALRHQAALAHPGFELTFVEHLKTPESMLSADPTLVQALANLLENAIQAAHREVRVTVSDTSAEVELAIVDDGDGIEPRVLEQLGEPFLSARPGGLGLGFFLANATIERLGGSIEVFSGKSGGTYTVVRLPTQSENVGE